MVLQVVYFNKKISSENDDKRGKVVSRDDLQCFSMCVDIRVLNFKVKWFHSSIAVLMHWNMQSDITGHSQRDSTSNITYQTQHAQRHWHS